MTKVVFENTRFRSNFERAIYVSSNASLAIKECYFENNGDQRSYGSAIRAETNVFLLIQDSSFYGRYQLPKKELF